MLFLSGCSGEAPAAGTAAGPATGSAQAGTASAGAGTVKDAPAFAASIALRPQEWAAGFTEGRPYEASGPDTPTVDNGCQVVTGPNRTGRIGTMTRSVRSPGGAAGESSADVYTLAEDAHRAIATLRADALRCPDATDGRLGRQYQGTRETAAPMTGGADEEYAEEGLTKAGDGSTSPYVRLVARKGAVTVGVYVGAGQGQDAATARTDARTALTKLLAKVPDRS